MEYQVFLSPRAKRDLIAIWKYIAKEDPVTADKFCRDLTLHAYSLKIFPDRTGVLPKKKYARKIPFESYLIYYKVDEVTRSVDILRFWHASRNSGRIRLD